jgi:hypothetical protein
MAGMIPSTIANPGSGNTLQYGNWSPAFFKPLRRSIGGIIAQVTIDEQASDDVQITEHPVEQGAPIADHAFKRPANISIRAGWTRQIAKDLSAESGVYGLLLSWQAALLPFDIYTGKRKYTNMLIERLQVTTDNHSEFALMATITCRQVIIVGTSTTTVTGLSNSPSDQKDASATTPEADGGEKAAVETGSTQQYQQLDPTNPNVEQLGSPVPSTTPEVPGEGASMTTPLAQGAEDQMMANAAQPPNNPQVQTPAGAADMPMFGM